MTDTDDQAPLDFPTGPDLNNRAWPADLAEKHRLFLHDRGVSPEVAAARGYLTVTSKSSSGDLDLSRFGWGKGNPVRLQINRDRGEWALVIPLYNPNHSEPSLHQIRLDKPRRGTDSDGQGSGGRHKLRKYELPHGTERGNSPGDLPADVNPLRASAATDTDHPLFITEGIPKADSVLTAAIAEGIDIVPVALTGVTMGYEAKDPAHDQVVSGALKDYILTPALEDLVGGRDTIYLCWDSDWADNPMVRKSLVRTGHLLRKAGVENVVYLGVPPTADAGKTGVDDWLASGGKLSFLLSNCTMDEPPIEDDKSGNEAIRNRFQVDVENRCIWDWEMRRVGSASKPEVVQEEKLAAIGWIADTSSECRIIDHLLVPETEIYTVRLEWVARLAGGREIVRSASIDVPATEFRDVSKWLASHGRAGRIAMAPSRTDQNVIATTITSYTDELVAQGVLDDHQNVTATTNGWFYSGATDETQRSGWRYVHGGGWIGAPSGVVLGKRSAPKRGLIASLEPTVGTDIAISPNSEARFCEPLIEGDRDDQVAAFNQWVDDWVLGGIVDRLEAENPDRFRPKGTQERQHLDDLKVRLALGAVMVARSILPGNPAMGTFYFVGPPSSGKTLLARVFTSCFGDRFGERPYLSFGSTSAGVEVKLADARNMLALVDDFHPSTGREMETMSRVIDQIARGAYDGAVKSRSTRDLKAMEAPQIAGSVVLTGEELPSVSSASNSVIQRLIAMVIRHQSAPAYEVMTYLTSNTAPQRQATGYMIGALAHMLDEATNTNHQLISRTVSEATATVLSSLTENQDYLFSLVEDVALRRTVDPTERTKTIIRDLLLGASLIIALAEDSGRINKPSDFDPLCTAIAEAVGWAMTETARVVSDTTPSANIVEAITQILANGSGHLVTSAGTAPLNDTALTWGWLKRPDNSWDKGGHQIGFVVQYQGATYVAIAPTTVSMMLRQVTGDREYTTVRIQQAVSQALLDDDTPALAFGHNDPNPCRVVTINGQRQRMLLFDATTLGVDITALYDANETGDTAAVTAEEDTIRRSFSSEQTDWDNVTDSSGERFDFDALEEQAAAEARERDAYWEAELAKDEARRSSKPNQPNETGTAS